MAVQVNGPTGRESGGFDFKSHGAAMPCLLAAVTIGLLLAASSSAFGQHAEIAAKADLKHLEIKGDLAASLVLAENWEPPSIVRDAEGKVTESPFHCSTCQEEGAYAQGAIHPAPPATLCQQGAGDLVKYLQREHKLKPIVLATKHNTIVVDLPGMKNMSPPLRDWVKAHALTGKSDLDRHIRAHVFALRYLHLEAQFLDLLCMLPGEPEHLGPRPPEYLGSNGRGEVYIFPLEAPYREFGRHFFRGFGTHTSWWWFDDAGVGVSALDASNVADPILAARFDHQMAHHLLMQYRGFLYHFPVWISEGIGHFFERRHRQFEDTYCILGHIKDFTWSEKNWWKAIKATVGAGEDLKLQTLALITKLEDLSPPQHAQAWSMVSYMIGLGKPRWRTFIMTMKAKLPEEGLPELQYRAIESAYGADLESFQNAWRSWVRTTKPPKGR